MKLYKTFAGTAIDDIALNINGVQFALGGRWTAVREYGPKEEDGTAELLSEDISSPWVIYLGWEDPRTCPGALLDSRPVDKGIVCSKSWRELLYCAILEALPDDGWEE